MNIKGEERATRISCSDIVRDFFFMQRGTKNIAVLPKLPTILGHFIYPRTGWFTTQNVDSTVSHGLN